MAEVLGLVASGISVAQIAGEIISAGIKLKNLLDEIEEAPDTLLSLIDRVEHLAPVLCSISIEEHAAPLPAHLHGSLQNAISFCRKASDQLELLARDLSSKLETSRGSRRKINMAKVVLKKSLLRKYELRLQAAVQHLSLAQQTYILYVGKWHNNPVEYIYLRTKNFARSALQQLQPSIIVSQVLKALDTRNPSQEMTCVSASKSTRVPESKSSSAPKHKSEDLRSIVRFGSAAVTGSVEIQVSSDETHDLRSCGEDDFIPLPRLRVRIHMPMWLCTSVIDSVVSRSISGWTCSLNTYGLLREDSAQVGRARDAFRNDDLSQIRILFQKRQLNPLDCVYIQHERHEDGIVSLLGVSCPVFYPRSNAASKK